MTVLYAAVWSIMSILLLDTSLVVLTLVATFPIQFALDVSLQAATVLTDQLA